MEQILKSIWFVIRVRLFALVKRTMSLGICVVSEILEVHCDINDCDYVLAER